MTLLLNIENFFNVPWYELLIIFLLKVLEITVMTVRLILVNRGFKVPASILAFFELILWVFVAGSVLDNVMKYPIKGIVYSLAYSVGVYLGSIIEKKLAFGKVMLQIILPTDESDAVAALLREQRIGVTTVNAQGYKGSKAILIVYANRKGVNKLKEDILKVDPNVVIGESDITELSGGTINPRRRLFK